MVARMRMGSGMTTPFAVRWLASDGPRQDCMQRLTERRSAAAAPQGDLDLFPGEIVLAVGFHQRQNVRGLRHFHSGRDERLGPLGEVETGRDGARVFLDEYRDRLRFRQ